MVLNLNRDDTKTLHQQICEQLREQILSGRLPSAFKMPSTRLLSQNYSISRNVFLSAFEQLTAEGYLFSRSGKGTFVAENITRHTAPVKSTAARMKTRSSSAVKQDFSIGLPDLSQSPLTAWGRCLRKAAGSLKPSEMGYSNSSCHPELAEVLEEHLLRTRGLRFDSSEIFLCSGSFQALLLAMTTSLRNSGKQKVVIENPSFNYLNRNFAAAGAALVPGSCDAAGLIPEKIPDGKDIALVSTTPSHLFPTGGVFPIDRRLKLCALAEKQDFYIVENEFEGDLRLIGSPVPALRTLSPERIFHAGSFSQILFPAERIGYLIVPSRLADEVKEHSSFSGYGLSVTLQKALAEFIREGLLARHYRKMKRLYREKQDILTEELHIAFPEGIEINGLDTGMYISLDWPGIEFSQETAKALERNGILADYTYRHYWPGRPQAPGMLLGFGNLALEKIPEAVQDLRKTLIKVFPEHLM